MPRLPAYQPGQVGPVQAAGERFRPANNNGGWAGGAAEGLHKLSRTVGKIAEDRIEIQNAADQAKAREQWLSFKTQGDALLANAEAARGLDASKAVNDARDELEKLRREALSPLAGNKPVSEMLRSQLGAQIANYEGTLVRHEKQQVFNAADAAFAAQASSARDDAIRLWDKPDEARAHVEGGKSIIRQRADMLGYGEEQTAGEVKAFESSAIRGTISSLFARGDNEAAIAFSDANLSRMTADDQTAMSGLLRAAREDRLAYADAMEVIGAGVATKDIPVASGGKFSLPVAGGRATSGFGAARGEGRGHNGVDWAAPLGTPVTPMAPGRVVSVASDARSGKFVVVDHGDGLTTSYSHLGRQDVAVGDTVQAGTVLGVVGMTGRTTGPHVHTVARQHGKPIDPVSLLGKGARGGASGAGWDLKAGLAAIDRKDWSFERKQAAKAALQREFSQRDAAEAREEREADREASAMVLELGDRFRSMEQIPEALRDRMSVGSLATYTAAAKANAAPTGPPANSVDFLILSRQAQQDPAAFASVNLGEYIGKVTDAQLRGLSDKQGAIIRGGQGAIDLRETIEGTISTFALPEMKLTGKGGDTADRIRVHDSMEAYLRALTGGKRKPTPSELRDAFNTATRAIIVQRPGRLWGTNETTLRPYDLQFDDIPKAEVAKARAALERAGEDASEQAIVDLYVQKLAATKAR